LDGRAVRELAKARHEAWAGRGELAVNAELAALADAMRKRDPAERPAMRAVVLRLRAILDVLDGLAPMVRPEHTCGDGGTARLADAFVQLQVISTGGSDRPCAVQVCNCAHICP
jgi:hypothetical protein